MEIEKIEVNLKQVIREYTPNSKHIERCVQNQEPVCTDTAVFMRLPVFPATKPPSKKVTFETNWGRVTIQNPVTQRHQDLLECLLYLTHKIEIDGANRVIAYVDMYQIRKKLSKNSDRIPEKDILRMIEEIEDVKLITEHTIHSDGQQVIIQVRGRIIDKTTTVSARARNKKEKKILKIVFGDMVSAMVLLDRLFLYDPEKIVRLRHSYSKAIARFLLSHEAEKEKKWKLVNVLAYLGIRIAKDTSEKEEGKIYISQEQYRKIVKRIKEDLPVLSELGITIEKHNNEYFLICDSKKKP